MAPRELGRLTPKAGGVRAVSTWLLDAVEQMLRDAPEMPDTTASEAWKAWARDPTGLDATREMCLQWLLVWGHG